jgi:hypothetical protein
MKQIVLIVFLGELGVCPNIDYRVTGPPLGVCGKNSVCEVKGSENF